MSKLLPCPRGLAYLPYQAEAIEWARNREAVLFGDEMRLGKTIQALGFINCHPMTETVLVVCPDTAKINWKREMQKWLISTFIEKTVINYDRLHELDYSKKYDVCILDEGHYIKNEETIRAQFCLRIKADRRLALDGTPILSRPIELWPILRYLYPAKFPTEKRGAYSIRYCNGHVANKEIKRRDGSTFIKKVWDERGASNLVDLERNLRQHIMIRRLRRDVWQYLPPRRELVELPTDSLPQPLWGALMEANQRFDFIAKKYEKGVAEMIDALNVAWSQMAVLRHDVGMEKARMSIDFVKDAVEGSGKVVLFAWHHDVIDYLAANLEAYNPQILHGGMNGNKKQKALDTFKNDSTARVFIGQILTAGVAISLASASHEIFVEQDWTPGIMDQAESRCEDKDQKEAVFVQHLALENSLDARMFKTQRRKRTVIGKALGDVR